MLGTLNRPSVLLVVLVLQLSLISTASAWDFGRRPVSFAVKGENWVLAYQDPERVRGVTLILTPEKAVELSLDEEVPYVYQDENGGIWIGTNEFHFFEMANWPSPKIPLKPVELLSPQSLISSQSPWSFAVEGDRVAAQTFEEILAGDRRGGLMRIPLDTVLLGRNSLTSNPEIEKVLYWQYWVAATIVHPRFVGGELLITSNTAVYRLTSDGGFTQVIDVTSELKRLGTEGTFVISQSAVTRHGDLFLLGLLPRGVERDTLYAVVKLSKDQRHIEKVTFLNDLMHGKPLGMAIMDQHVLVLFGVSRDSQAWYTLCKYDATTLDLVSLEEREYTEFVQAEIEIAE